MSSCHTVRYRKEDHSIVWDGGTGGKVDISPWRLSFITDMFWEIAEFVFFCFFKTLLLQYVKKEGKGYGSSSDFRYEEGRRPSEGQKLSRKNGSDQSSPRHQPSSNAWWVKKVNVHSKQQTTRYALV